jgi:hypothetical protein
MLLITDRELISNSFSELQEKHRLQKKKQSFSLQVSAQ